MGGLGCFKNCIKKKVHKWWIGSRFSYMCEWWEKALHLASPYLESLKNL